MLPIKNIYYLSPMCCNFWGKCIKCHKIGQGCSTPLSTVHLPSTEAVPVPKFAFPARQTCTLLEHAGIRCLHTDYAQISCLGTLKLQSWGRSADSINLPDQYGVFLSQHVNKFSGGSLPHQCRFCCMDWKQIYTINHHWKGFKRPCVYSLNIFGKQNFVHSFPFILCIKNTTN